MPDLIWLLIPGVAIVCLFCAAIGYRLKIHYGSRLHWPERPAWAPLNIGISKDVVLKDCTFSPWVPRMRRIERRR